MDLNSTYIDFNRSRIRFEWVVIRFILISIGAKSDFNGY